ncbi:MAG: hypothetical protein KAS74_03935 [Methanosarcinales archaeon]|nr:hypothetical protein [Methanosarcinales archaeon]
MDSIRGGGYPAKASNRRASIVICQPAGGAASGGTRSDRPSATLADAVKRIERASECRGHAGTNNGHRKTRAASAPNAGDRESMPPPDDAARESARPSGHADMRPPVRLRFSFLNPQRLSDNTLKWQS